MFVYSVRASTVKFFSFIAVTLVLLLCIVVGGADGIVAASSSRVEIDYGRIKTNEQRVEFMERFGIKVEEAPTETVAFTMPENFDRVILGYNELQKKQGLDLSKYSKKKVTRYTYKVTNYDSSSDVYANLFIYRSKIVACDISSANPDGFVIPLTLVDTTKLK